MDEFYIFDHSFVYSNIGINRPQVVRKTIKSIRMGICNGKEIEKDLDKICKEIKGESSNDHAVRVYNYKINIRGLLDRIFHGN